MENAIAWTVHSVDFRRERRPHRRQRVLCPALIVFNRGEDILHCSIRDLSPGGGRIAFPLHSRFPSHFHLIDFPGRTAYEARVIWSSECQAGLSLHGALAMGAIADPALAFLERLWREQAR